MDEVIRDFLVESYEGLDQLDQDLLTLEQDPTDSETLKRVFRTTHTIKGTCGFFSFSKLESVAHVGESLLVLLRDNKLLLNPQIATGLLAMVDAFREILGKIETEHTEGDTDYTALIEQLNRLQRRGEPAPRPKPVLPPADLPLDNLGDIFIHKGQATVAEVEAAAVQQQRGDPRRLGEILVEQGVVKPQEVVEALKEQAEARPAVSDSNIRVDVALLDKLMNLVGELVLVRNQVLQYTATQQDSAITVTSQRLNLITTELQEGVMKTRMQPIGNVWSKFPRVVRDLASACGKQIRIEMEGKETELDKTIIESIKDPLTHIVRNSADHGIETPQARVAKGKPAEGCLRLRAFHEGGQVNIEVSDDGNGVDGEWVKAKALQKGLITAGQASRMTEREMVNLIFLPGFSTAEEITNISGRGVGMDVVKTNIEKIGGTVDVQSKLGQGTTLRMKIPLTLAIIPALIVTSGEERYAIPQVSLVELVRLEGEQVRSGIETINGALLYRLRGSLLPLVNLTKELKCEVRSAKSELETDALGTSDEIVNIVVLQAGGRPFGLVVEGINDTEEIVVKPLGKQLKGISVFAGATIMGDGRVALILDVMGIAQHCNVVAEVCDRALAAAGHSEGEGDPRQTLLVFQLGKTGRMAIPLSLVARLEEFSQSLVERAGRQEVVQYRKQILPLIRLTEMLGQEATGVEADPMQVVVYKEGGRSVGLVVERILDIVEESLAVQRRSSAQGILGSAVIQQKVTDLLDVPAIVRSVDPSFYEHVA